MKPPTPLTTRVHSITQKYMLNSIATLTDEKVNYNWDIATYGTDTETELVLLISKWNTEDKEIPVLMEEEQISLDVLDIAEIELCIELAKRRYPELITLHKIKEKIEKDGVTLKLCGYSSRSDNTGSIA